MAETRGFEVVAEVKDTVLLEMLKSAWDNGGTSDPGAIPHEVPVPSGLSIGPYVVGSGQVTIPREGVTLVMAPAHNGVTLGFDTEIQVNLDPATTPLASLNHFQMTASILVTAPFGIVPGTSVNVGVILAGLPRDRVTVTLTSGHPVSAITLDMIREHVHELYVGGTIPHTQSFPNESYGGIQYDAFVEFFDDQSDPNRSIEVTQPDPHQLRVSIPMHLRLSNLSGQPGIELLSPMGVTARVILTVPFSQTDAEIRSELPAAVVSVEDLRPADGVEGSNYTTAQAIVGADTLDTLFIAQIALRGQAMVGGMTVLAVPIPTVAEIEALMGDEVHAELIAREYVGTWTPESPEGSPVDIVSVVPKALANAVAIGVNPGAGANADLLDDFIPTGQAFAIGLDAEFVEQTIGEIVARPVEDGGFGGIPRTFDNIEGHRVDLDSLHWRLQDGAIHFWGDCTVHDVFCGANADVSFWADVGLRWTAPDSSGGQTLEPFLLDSDADLPWWAWLLAVLGFLFGIILGVIAIVITVVIENVVERVGASVMEDEVSNQVQALGAWPQDLQGIGSVTSTFDEAVIVESTGLVFMGSILITAQYGLTSLSWANSQGPYVGKAAHAMLFQAGPPHPSCSYYWDFGDGSAGNGHQVEHMYEDDGIFVVRLRTTVNEPGGAVTFHSSPMVVQNVQPTVEAGSDLTVMEGQDFVVTGHFEDKEWLDTHEATWDFGDDSLPKKGLVNETNLPPRAQGTVAGTHAYCNNGAYTVKLQVRDDDGGVAEDHLTVHVVNVAPKVSIPEPLFAHPCVPVTIVAHFTDPGWCDSHCAEFKFGDGDHTLEATPGTVVEVREPPMGFGIAAATHTYRALSTHLVECRVTDSDGAAGTATAVLRVVDLVNGDFEGGFHAGPAGEVANFWHPFALGGSRGSLAEPSSTVGMVSFAGEKFVVRDGQRSQRIEFSRSAGGGLLQTVGANLGWDYQVSAYYHVDSRVGGVCRLGVDPSGGTDPSAPGIVWSEGAARESWRKLLVRVTASGPQITIFLMASSQEGPARCYFDGARLDPFPCPLPDPKPPEEEATEPREECVSFAEEQKARELPEVYGAGFLRFMAMGNEPLGIVLWGEPEGTGKLAFPPRGARVHLPFPADKVTCQVVSYAGRPVSVRGLDERGRLVGEITSSSPHRQWQTLALTGSGIVQVEVSGGGGEGLLLWICAYQESLALARWTRNRPTPFGTGIGVDGVQREAFMASPPISGSREEVQVTRSYPFPATRVFDAWLDPVSIGRWLFATPEGTMIRTEMEPWVGGTFRLVDRRAEGDAEHVGEYVELDRPRRLVFTFKVEMYGPETSRVTVEIVPQGDGCHLTLSNAQVEEEHAEQTRRGWADILEGLARTLGEGPPGPTA